MSNNYSVWLVPEEDSKEMNKLNSMISSYSEEYGTPDFIPHVTLVGGIEMPEKQVKDKVRELAEEHSSFEISFRGSHFSTTKHQCNYLLVDPTVEPLEMYKGLLNMFEINNSIYVPHLSLIYGDLELIERAELDKEIQSSDWPEGFNCSRILLYDTSGKEEDWNLVEEFRL